MFEQGKFYKHTSGDIIAVIGVICTTMFWETFICETTGPAQPYFKCVGMGEGHDDNWTEIPESEWYAEFNMDYHKEYNHWKQSVKGDLVKAFAQELDIKIPEHQEIYRELSISPQYIVEEKIIEWLEKQPPYFLSKRPGIYKV